MFSAVLLSAVLCICVVLWWRARVRESRAHPLPPLLPNALPIIGHFHKLLTSAANIWQVVRLFSNYTIEQGGVAHTYFGPDIYYFLTDPEDTLTVANACLDKHFAYNFASYWLGQGLITGSGETWQRHRKLLNPVFSLPVIHGFLEVFNQQSRALVSTIEPYVDKGEVDIASEIRKITLETSCLTAFGESDCKDKSFTNYMTALEEFLKLLIGRAQKFWLHNETLNHIFGPREKEDKLVKILKGVSDDVIQKNRQWINGTEAGVTTTKDIRYQPFVNQILENPNKYPLTDQEIREELDTIIAAAYDTSNNFSINLFAMIGSFPEVQEKIYEEIMRVIGPDRDVEKEDLQKLVYTDAVLKETLRLLPTVPLIMRYIDKDVKLKNYTLRAGNQCIIFLNGINRHPSWGADADQFRPERWLDAATLPKNPNTFAAFSIGKRSCIGRTYAISAAKVTLAHVVRKYRLTADHNKMQFVFDITLKTVAGREVTLQRRN